jgi:hypothetical protein
MSDMPVLEPAVVTAIEDYFRSLQAHASAEQMLADVLTSDFQTGFAGGHMWTGNRDCVTFERSVGVLRRVPPAVADLRGRLGGRWASTPERTAAPVPDSRRFPTLPLLPLRG